MRIEHNDFDDLLDDIEHEKNNITAVRFRIEKDPEQDPPVTYRYGLWVTALVMNENYPLGIHVIEFGETAGSDSPGHGELNGKDLCDAWVERLKDKCKDLELELRPGKIELI